MDKELLQNAVEQILKAIGEDVKREGLVETPDRVARYFMETMAGINENPDLHLEKKFTAVSKEMVIVSDISFSSTCEHHLLPFFGKVHVAYIPNKYIVGLSKLPRVVEGYSKRPQIQEQLTHQIANSVYHNLSALGVLVIIEAKHMCMMVRGVKDTTSVTRTIVKCGAFIDDQELTNEALCLIKGGFNG